jgi:uncharacterized repeat protein (TIGR01451 family)
MDVSANSSTATVGKNLFLRKIFLLAVFFFFHAHAKTPANTLVLNSAVLTYTELGIPNTAYSNTSSYRVDEILSFTLTSDNPGGISVQTPDTGAVHAYTLTNQGNGVEKFNLSVTQSVIDDFNPTQTKIFLDTNNNGTYDTGTDLQYSAGTVEPNLIPDAAIHIFVVSDVPASLSPNDEAHISLVVSPATGSGPTGTLYSGGGDGGVEALMGSPGGNYSVENFLKVSVATPLITKSQSFLDPNGGTTIVHDTIITYTLTLTVTGAGTVSNMVILDTIPAGTVFVPGSIRLDASPLSDAADLDNGVFTGTEVQVSLPTVPAPATHAVIFKVRIL